MIDYRPYLLSWLALLVLLACSVAATHWLDGWLAWSMVALCALLIASLVISVFMGLRHANALLRVFGVGGVLWLSFLIVLTLADYLTR